MIQPDPLLKARMAGRVGKRWMGSKGVEEETGGVLHTMPVHLDYLLPSQNVDLFRGHIILVLIIILFRLVN